MDINQWLSINKNKFIGLRRHLHSYPEVGFKEVKTSNHLQTILKEASYSITQNKYMQTGFCVDYGEENKSVLAIRCDLDGLPIEDKKDKEYSSKIRGAMHACGHDAHMTIATGTALYIKENNLDIPGKVRFIFQPAEETAPGGAVEMIKGGAIENVNHIIGYHVFPALDSNQIGLKNQYVSAAVEAHDFEFKGMGGHTSRPEETDDLIGIASEFIFTVNNELNKIKNNLPFVLTFGNINSGYTYNVIPDVLSLKGTFRYLNIVDKDNVYQIINRIIDNVESKYKIKVFHKVPYASPPVINDNFLTDIINDSAISTLGHKNVINLEKPSMGGEDFSFYLELCPGSYFRIGSNDGKTKDLHTPDFDINEECIFTGIKVLVESIKKYFQSV